jgi:hypothetical protein
VAASRSWNVGLLTKTELGRRNRRTVDSVVLLLAAFILALSALIASSAPEHDEDVAHALATVLGWGSGLWQATFVTLLVLALAVVVDLLYQRRWDLARDVLVACLGTAGAAAVLGGVVESDWLPIEAHVLARWSYPELRLALATTVLVVVGPELVRSVRVLATWLVPLAALGMTGFGGALPSSVLGALALGIGMGAVVRLIFGTAAGVPPSADIERALASLGVDVDDLRPSPRQHMGAAEYVGRHSQGRPLRVRVLGKDAQDTQRLARRWRSLAYRDPPRSVVIGRLEQVEHEALATLLAARAGVRVPKVVTAALGPDGDALLATEQPDVEPSNPTSSRSRPVRPRT